jgi:hypothetical protein
MKSSRAQLPRTIRLATAAAGGIVGAVDRSGDVPGSIGSYAAESASEFVVQTNEKRTVNRSEPAVADPISTAKPAADDSVPTLLDMAASPAIEGIGQRTLLDVSMDLFSKLEASLVTNRDEFIESYFATLVKQDEMATLWTEPAYYEHLRSVIVKEVLPLYDRYCAVREKLQEKMDRRSWSKYCVWAIGVCLGLELLFTEGRVLRPQALLPAVAVDGLLGYALYYVVNFRESSALKRMRKNLLNSIHELDTKYEVAKRYEIFRNYSGGELLTAELQLLLAGYGSPDEFWKDYHAVRKADPTAPAELETLPTNRFNNFLKLHVNGGYSREARQQRFNALFLLAHKTFILKDRENYVLAHLQSQKH